jgi:hypothetical protein
MSWSVAVSFETLGVDALAGYAQLDEGGFRRVHHRIRPADEELKAAVTGR